MTPIKQLLNYGRAHLPPLEARLLAEHVLGVGHAYLVAHDDELVTAEQLATYQALIHRAAQHEPIPYLIGHAPFYGREFAVSPAVLIPRPETELLVGRALRWLAEQSFAQPPQVVDVGTGSGCIAITLACECPTAEVTAIDISAEALAIAQRNGAAHGAAVRWVQGDLLAAVPPPIHLLVANLPYITDGEWTSLADGVKSYEPTLALRGGVDGLDLVRPLLAQATHSLASPSLILLEIGWQQGQATCTAARNTFPHATITLHPDDAGHDRLVEIVISG